MRTPLFYHEKEQIIRLVVASALLRAAIKQLRIDGHPATDGVTCFYAMHLNETIGLLEEALVRLSN